MAFRDEERRSSIISGAAIFRQVVDQRFEDRIKEVKSLSANERVNAGRNLFAQMIEKFRFLWDREETDYITAL